MNQCWWCLRCLVWKESSISETIRLCILPRIKRKSKDTSPILSETVSFMCNTIVDKHAHVQLENKIKHKRTKSSVWQYATKTRWKNMSWEERLCKQRPIQTFWKESTSGFCKKNITNGVSKKPRNPLTSGHSHFACH